MSDHLKATIADLQTELRRLETSVIETKRLINALCIRGGMTAMYGDAELETSTGPSLTIKNDQFYGQPMISALRKILEMRKALDQGPATINELYDAMGQGGFKFEAKDEDNSKRGIRISVTKNSGIFHKLPNSRIGLLEWYPKVKPPKKGEVTNDEGDNEPPAEDS